MNEKKLEEIRKECLNLDPDYKKWRNKLEKDNLFLASTVIIFSVLLSVCGYLLITGMLITFSNIGF